ncbi:uncharacterized protein LOC126765062 [Bactrocera neohumeralis]|uniref:uncharacterized protein LOC126765062 n=1 Tax=Bactrocera neohumeralis TaxID=98809 RepID=UPI002165ED2E|nr:uncharacterized protein LOC126765062 [Bactrocera neohumeralis]
MQKLCLLIWWKRLQNRKGRGGSCGVRKMLLKRPKEGHFTLLIPKIRLNDVETFINFHRMDPNSFDELLHILGPSMRNTPNKSEEEITQTEILALTLRYLASGDSMKSIGFYGFRIGASTTSNIIRETCELIWKKLQFVFPAPSEEVWANVADDFFLKWGFPNCLGAIDGKHVVVQAFPNHNSLTYNYKHTHSIILMAVADANYKFIMVDIGALGHNSDGGVFKSCRFGYKILHHPADLKIGEGKLLPNSNEVAPFVFLADEAFPLRRNIMLPYPGRNIMNLPQEEVIFNNHLSRARRVVENAFGIMASRFRIFRKPIIASKQTARNIVKATVCLHNWLREKSAPDDVCVHLQNIQREEQPILQSFLQPVMSSHSNHASQDAIAVRRMYTNYFKNLPENI